MNTCLTPDQAQALLLDQLDASETREAREHLAACAACRRWISALAVELESTSGEGARSSVGKEHDLEGARELEIGDRIGRYVIDGWLGRGGMGCVFSGCDTLLGRRVAIKHVHGEFRGSPRRLQHEAQMLARLHDPNIVEVYDVGTENNRLYIVMELVEGMAVDAWLREAPRGIRDIVEVFLGAGRGLAAAHRLGVLHRDFKPSNVIVARDGRPRVIDFGLSASIESGKVPNLETLDPGSAPEVTIVGTPHYMAPEIKRGEPATVLSDQWSFCKALAEAIAKTSAQHRASFSDDERTPRWLSNVLLRGLAEDPQHRWPTLESLLATLSRGNRRRLPRTVAYACAGAMAVAWLSTTPAAPERCRAGAVEDVWNAKSQRAVQRAILATQVPWATRAASRVQTKLDTFTEDWSRAYAAACEAKDAQTFDHQMHCLQQLEGRLAATVSVLQQIDRQHMETLENLADLPLPSQCFEDGAGSFAEPHDARTRSSLERKVARVEALHAAGMSRDALHAATRIAPDVEAHGFVPLTARLELACGMARAAELPGDAVAVGSLERAVSLAISVGDDSLAAQAAVALAEAFSPDVAISDGRASQLFNYAQALVLRAGVDDRLARRLARLQGWRLEFAGNQTAALEAYERAFVHATRAYGPSSTQVAAVLLDIGGVLRALGRVDEALERHAQAVDAFTRSVGPNHPWTASAYEALGHTYLATGRVAEATEAFQKVVQIREGEFGPNHLAVAVALGNWGGALVASSALDEGIAALERALTIEEQLAPDHVHLAAVLNHLGNGYKLAGRSRAAATAYARASVLIESTQGPEHPNLAVALAGLASVQMLFDPDAAVKTARQALQIRSRSLGPTHAALASNAMTLGQAQHAAGDLAGALDALTTALELAQSGPAGARFVPYAQYALAQALRDAKRPGAEALARRAAETFAATDDEASLADVQEWLQEIRAERP